MIAGKGAPCGVLDIPPYMFAVTISVYTEVILSHLSRGPAQRSGLRDAYNRLCDAWQSMMKMDALTDLVVDVPPAEIEAIPDKARGKKSVNVDSGNKAE